MFKALRNLLFGGIMAIGELVPGVGMQTVAIIMGVYDELINFLFQGTEFLKILGIFLLGKSSKEKLFQSFKDIPWIFGIPVFGGILLTILLLAKSTTAIFETYPSEVTTVAFGIVLASVMIPFSEMKPKRWQEYLIILLSFLMLFGIFGATDITAVSSENPAVLTFFIAGLLASLAGFFPGISITLALLLLGLYEPLFRNIETFTSGNITMASFLSVTMFLVGLGIGLLVCVRLLSVLIERFKSYFLAIIVGLILASLRATWPFIKNDIPVAPWAVPIPDFTKQLVIITISVVFVTILRKLAEGKGEISSSFGDRKRVKITS